MPKKNKGPDLDKYLEGRRKRNVSYFDGARMYGLPYTALCVNDILSPSLTGRFLYWINRRKRIKEKRCGQCCLTCPYYKECRIDR